MPSRENERELNSQDDNLKYDPISKHYLKRCEKGHWFIYELDHCPECAVGEKDKNKKPITLSSSELQRLSESTRTSEKISHSEITAPETTQSEKNKKEKETPDGISNQIAPENKLKKSEPNKQITTPNPKSKQESKDSKENESVPLQKCPSCGQISLFWNLNSNKYVCTNPECRQVYTQNKLLVPEPKDSIIDGNAQQPASPPESPESKINYERYMSADETQKMADGRYNQKVWK